MKKIQLPLTMEDRRSLRAGEQVLLSGVIYTARDARAQTDEGAAGRRSTAAV